MIHRKPRGLRTYEKRHNAPTITHCAQRTYVIDIFIILAVLFTCHSFHRPLPNFSYFFSSWLVEYEMRNSLDAIFIINILLLFSGLSFICTNTR